VTASVTGTLNVTSCASALSRSTSRPPTNIDTINEQVAKLEVSCLAAWQIRIAGGGQLVATPLDIDWTARAGIRRNRITAGYQ
jgi:hypothetical protein